MAIITSKIQASITAAQAIAMNLGSGLTEPRAIVDTPAALASLPVLVVARIALGLGEAAVFPASFNMIGWR